MTDALAAALLPKQNSTPYELALLGAMIEAWATDVEAIRRESDPMRCRPENLKALFFDRGGTYWNDGWPVPKQRRYVRDLLVYKRLEGTALGVELYANLEGAVILTEELPPDRGAIISDAGLDRDQILALMPQLRLYYHWPDRYWHKSTMAIGARAIGRSAVRRVPVCVLGRYPVLYEPRTGVETPLGISDFSIKGGKATFTFAGTRGHAFAIGFSGIGAGAFGPLHRSAPISFDLADPTMQTVRGTPPAYRQQMVVGGKAGRGLGRSAVRRVVPDQETYDRLYIWDGSRVPPRAGVTGPAMAVGVSRLGLPAYHQVLHMAVPAWVRAVPPRWRAVGQMPMFARRPDRPLVLAMQAIECARRPGDRILVKLENRRPGARPAPIPAIGDLA